VGLPLYGSALLFRLMGDGTIFVVDHFHGVDAVALYGGAYRLWVAFSLPQIAVNAALQPRLAMCASMNDPEGMEAMLHEASLLALVPTAAFTLVSLFAGGPLLSILYGSHYAQGASVLAILSVSQLLCVIVGSSEHLMSMTGRHMAVLYVTVLCATISLLLAWLLTPSFGLAGAACSAGLSSVLFKLFLALLARKQLGVTTVLPLRAIRWGRSANSGKAH
jgi:O-antigen/teichoic acid export membrane protein